ncbi:MAG: hypothetical protein ACJ8BF_11365 [Gemmatimonadales bacterium]
MFASPLLAQHVIELSSATRLRKEPEGIALVSLPAGASVQVRGVRGAWHEVVVEGWIFSQSTAPSRRDGFDLVVTRADGENIRRSPNGDVVGHIRSGALLRKVEAQGAWTHVRREGWVPREAVVPVESGDISPVQTDSPTVQAPVAQPVAPAPAVKPPADSDRAEAARETPLFSAPEAAQFGTIQTGSPARVLGRSGDWVRVQLEGWVRAGDLQSASGSSLSGVTAAEVRSDPTRYLGRAVEWRLQLIAVQTADELRTEMPRGQNYLLTRGPLPEPGFVYVTVSDAQAAEFRTLTALQEMTLRVTIKAARSKFLTTPIVEYVARVAD